MSLHNFLILSLYHFLKALIFFAGEVIDVDVKTGGYTVQAAFSTGWVCGYNI